MNEQTKRLTTSELKTREPFTLECHETVMWLVDKEGKRAAYVSSNGIFAPTGMCLTHNGALYLAD